MRRLGKALAIGIPLSLVTVAGWATLQYSGHHPAPRRPAAAAAAAAADNVRPPAHCPALMEPFFGVAVPSPTQRHLTAFIHATRARPTVVEHYLVFGDRFSVDRAYIAAKAGAVALLQWLPSHTPLAEIAAGRADPYIERFAKDVRAFRCPIMISFAHEMNGPWFAWGPEYQSPASFRAAWRRIYLLFRREHAANAVWVWNPDVNDRSFTSVPDPWWPGTGYVDMLALDGYYWWPGNTFRGVFQSSLRELHRLAPGKPVFIAETGAYPGAKMGARIRNLFRGAMASHLVGVVYFDMHHRHADWRIEGHPAAVRALRAGLKLFGALLGFVLRSSGLLRVLD